MPLYTLTVGLFVPKRSKFRTLATWLTTDYSRYVLGVLSTVLSDTRHLNFSPKVVHVTRDDLHLTVVVLNLIVCFRTSDNVEYILQCKTCQSALLDFTAVTYSHCVALNNLARVSYHRWHQLINMSL